MHFRQPGFVYDLDAVLVGQVPRVPGVPAQSDEQRALAARVGEMPPSGFAPPRLVTAKW